MRDSGLISTYYECFSQPINDFSYMCVHMQFHVQACAVHVQACAVHVHTRAVHVHTRAVHVQTCGVHVQTYTSMCKRTQACAVHVHKHVQFMYTSMCSSRTHTCCSHPLQFTHTTYVLTYMYNSCTCGIIHMYCTLHVLVHVHDGHVQFIYVQL